MTNTISGAGGKKKVSCRIIMGNRRSVRPCYGYTTLSGNIITFLLENNVVKYFILRYKIGTYILKYVAAKSFTTHAQTYTHCSTCSAPRCYHVPVDGWCWSYRTSHLSDQVPEPTLSSLSPTASVLEAWTCISVLAFCSTQKRLIVEKLGGL